jgi:hypothetical protein
MSRFFARLTAAAAAVAALLSASASLEAAHGYHQRTYIYADREARFYNATVPWHGPYYNTTWGQPMALIVPPTATFQTDYSWGVARTRMTPIRHQFVRPVPPPAAGGVPLLPTPHWPSDTVQFGVYPVRGPW